MGPREHPDREGQSWAEMERHAREVTFTGRGFASATPPSPELRPDWTILKAIYQNDQCDELNERIRQTKADASAERSAPPEDSNGVEPLKTEKVKLDELKQRAVQVARIRTEISRLVDGIRGPGAEIEAVSDAVTALSRSVHRLAEIDREVGDIDTAIAAQKDEISRLEIEAEKATDKRLQDALDALIDQEIQNVRRLQDVAARLAKEGHRVVPIWWMLDGPGQIDPATSERRPVIEGLTTDLTEIREALNSQFGLPEGSSEYVPPLVSDFALKFKKRLRKRAGLFIELKVGPDEEAFPQRYYWFRETGLRFHPDVTLPISPPPIELEGASKVDRARRLKVPRPQPKNPRWLQPSPNEKIPEDLSDAVEKAERERQVTAWDSLPAKEVWEAWEHQQKRSENARRCYGRDLDTRLRTLLEDHGCEPTGEGWLKLAVSLAMKYDPMFKVDVSDIRPDAPGKHGADRHHHIDSYFASLAQLPEVAPWTSRFESDVEVRNETDGSTVHAWTHPERELELEIRTSSNGDVTATCTDKDGKETARWTTPSDSSAAVGVRGMLDRERDLQRTYGLPVPKLESVDTLRVEHTKRRRRTPNTPDTASIQVAVRKKLKREGVFSDLLFTAAAMTEPVATEE